MYRNFEDNMILVIDDFINDISAAENSIDNKMPIDEYNSRNSDIDIAKIKQ